jgi:hypothetical protein
MVSCYQFLISRHIVTLFLILSLIFIYPLWDEFLTEEQITVRKIRIAEKLAKRAYCKGKFWLSGIILSIDSNLSFVTCFCQTHFTPGE